MKLLDEEVDALFSNISELEEKLKEDAAKAKALSESDLFLKLVKKASHCRTNKELFKDEFIDVNDFFSAVPHYSGELYQGAYAHSDDFSDVLCIKIDGVIFSVYSRFFLTPKDDENDNVYTEACEKINVIDKIDQIEKKMISVENDTSFLNSLNALETIYFKLEISKIKSKQFFNEDNIMFELHFDEYDPTPDTCSYEQLKVLEEWNFKIISQQHRILSK